MTERANSQPRDRVYKDMFMLWVYTVEEYIGQENSEKSDRAKERRTKER